MIACGTRRAVTLLETLIAATLMALIAAAVSPMLDDLRRVTGNNHSRADMVALEWVADALINQEGFSERLSNSAQLEIEWRTALSAERELPEVLRFDELKTLVIHIQPAAEAVQLEFAQQGSEPRGTQAIFAGDQTAPTERWHWVIFASGQLQTTRLVRLRAHSDPGLVP